MAGYAGENNSNLISAMAELSKHLILDQPVPFTQNLYLGVRQDTVQIQAEMLAHKQVMYDEMFDKEGHQSSQCTHSVKTHGDHVKAQPIVELSKDPLPTRTKEDKKAEMKLYDTEITDDDSDLDESLGIPKTKESKAQKLARYNKAVAKKLAKITPKMLPACDGRTCQSMY